MTFLVFMDLKLIKEIEIETRNVLKEDMKFFFEARYDLNRNDYFSIYVNRSSFYVFFYIYIFKLEIMLLCGCFSAYNHFG